MNYPNLCIFFTFCYYFHYKFSKEAENIGFDGEIPNERYISPEKMNSNYR